MASITSNLDLIIQSQASKEVTANGLFNSASPAMLFARRENSKGLTWYCYGGPMVVDGVLTVIANSAGIDLTASTTNYIEATRLGVVSKNITGFTPGSIPLYQLSTSAITVTSYTDYRAWVQPSHITSVASVSIDAGNVTLTQAQAACRYLTITSGAAVTRDLIVPNHWEGLVYCNINALSVVTIKTAAGTGVVVAPTMRAHLFADGTNVVRITADA